LLLFTGLVGLSTTAAAQTFTIDRAEWSTSDGGRLRVEGNGRNGRTVTIRNVGNNAVLGTDVIEDEEWDRRIRNLTQVPCRISASDGTTTLQRDVSNRPANCGPVVGGAQPTLTITDATAAEGADANFTVRLSATPSSNVTVTVATANVTATAGSDYNAVSRQLTFNAGTTTLTQTVAVRALTDNVSEGNETFNVNLSAATGATISDALGLGTITNVAPQAS
jgi:hypothetical protein